jgi:hypothetical protein
MDLSDAGELLSRLREKVEEEIKGPLDARHRASFCDWCKTKQGPEGLKFLRGMAWQVQACPCHLVSYCDARCQASDWVRHSDDCQMLRGADAEGMPLLEGEAADLASIKLADEVKRLRSELAAYDRQYKFHGVMDALVQHLDIARENAALIERHRRMMAKLAECVLIEPQRTVWHTLDQSELEYVHDTGAVDDEDWEKFVQQYQERFSEECNEIGRVLFTQFCEEYMFGL